jgi:ribonuclease BN (tRNA processing enzyme)
MDVTFLGTGNPCPQLERAGTGMIVSIGSENILLDCGPMTCRRLFEYQIDPTTIQNVFFTHHHMDHNADFHYFAIVSWRLGRRSLTVFGPDGTEELLEGLETAFHKTIESWVKDTRPSRGIMDIDYTQTTEDLHERTPAWEVTAMSVDHSMETYAYRFKEKSTGDSFVFSGDTVKVPALSEFAEDANILVHDCNARDDTEPLLDENHIPDRYLEPPYESYYHSRFEESAQSRMNSRHATPTEAAEIAENANVDELVLTHLNPYRDPDAIRKNAKKVFNGAVQIAQDGVVLST